jgi:hypothetical protein
MTRRLTLALVLVLAATAAIAQPRDAGLARLDFLVGEWRGTSSGRPGDGKVERVCAKVLSDRFVECRTTVTYPPQEKNPKGEVHVERAFFSYDKRAKLLRLRQFHGEGFVNTYTETEPLSFVTVDIENIPAGWRARETFASPSADTWTERFELAEPGKEFAVYSSSTMERVKPSL